MAQPVEISVRTQLSKIAKELDQIAGSFNQAESHIKKTASAVDESVKKTLDTTETGVGKTASLMKRAFQGFKSDLKGLSTLATAVGGVGVGAVIKNSITGMFSLTDAVRKYSGVLGIAQRDQSAFLSSLVSELSEVGAGADEAASSIEGIAQTQIRDPKTMIQAAKMSTMLSSVGNEAGQGGTIAAGIAGVTQLRGKNVDIAANLSEVAEAVNKVRLATGAKPTEVIGFMKDFYSRLDDTFKKTMTPQAVAKMFAANASGNTASASFFADYYSRNNVQRAQLNAFGFSKLFSPEGGVNEGVLQNILGQAKGIGGGNAVFGLQTMGVANEDQAKALVNMGEQFDKIRNATLRVEDSTQNLARSFDEARTSVELFTAILNNGLKILVKPLDALNRIVNPLLKEVSKSDLGSAAATGLAGAGALAAAGKTLSLIPGLGGAGGAIGALGTTIAPVAAAGAGVFAGAKAGEYVGKSIEGTQADRILSEFVLKMSQLIGLIPQTLNPRFQGAQPPINVQMHDPGYGTRKTYSPSTGPSTSGVSTR